MDLYQVCSYDVPGVKTGPARGSQVRRPVSKFFFSETGRNRALLFVSKHLHMNLYQVCSYHVLGVKTTPTPGIPSCNIGSKKTNFKILLV